MILDFCVMCSSKEELHNHHINPRVLEGSDDETNLITVCKKCHSKLHEYKKKWNIRITNGRN